VISTIGASLAGQIDRYQLFSGKNHRQSEQYCSRP